MFRDNNGLITVDEEGTSAENSFLWTVELFVVLRKKGECTNSLQFTIDKAIEKMSLGNGLYKQAPHIAIDSNNKDSYMSHDQLTALMCYFKLTNQKEKMIDVMKAFKYGVSYNNVDNKFRPFHPRDLIFYNIISGGTLSWLFVWLLWLITMVTFIDDTKERNGQTIKKTDGELLYYIKRETTVAFKPINWFCEMRVKQRFGSWDNLFSTYFKVDNHIINEIKNK